MLDKPRHALVVRSLPVESVAFPAKVEFIVVPSRFWRETITDHIFRNRFEQSVAVEAAPEWRNVSR